LRYAPLWRRALACLVDFLIVAAAVVPAAIVLIWIMEASHEDLGMKVRHARYLAGIGAVALWVFGDWFYNACMMTSEWEATIGKRIFRVRILDAKGQRVTFWQATARHFSKFLSTFLLGAGFIMAAFSHRRQALHDVVADTIACSR
jgi:uncharacterized RDD family membrane protein YckC